MPVNVATGLVVGCGVYLALGLLFAVAFVTRGAQRIDPAARTGTPGFRLLILPGAAALWPLLLRRWLAGGHAPPPESNAHRQAATACPDAPDAAGTAARSGDAEHGA